MSKKLTPVKRDNLPYRDCVGCVVFNKNGEVLVCKRKSGKQITGGHVWQFPQGGIDGGEQPFDAAIRELYEETSIKSVSLITAASNWIFYDLPEQAIGIALKGKYRGQRQKWFAFIFEGDESEINVTNPAEGKHEAEFLDWRWEKLKKTPKLIVPFKREAYQQIVFAFEHIVKQQKQKSIKIKKLNSKHLAMWVELRSAFFTEKSHKTLKNEAIAMLENKKARAFGLFKGKTLVAFAEVKKCRINGVKTALLAGIYISQGYRQWGLDKKLLNAVEKWAKEHSLNEINASININEKRSISNYKSLGFSETERVVFFRKTIK